ncbi:Utp14-domain-containing protein [Massarina eburnea CBS 473.64]|uniref:Utp14-domain-containing protein n=1 Tax=Massarina eburnea CBS 473.64 TaxID=1395130 RepID=A0A6A6S9Y8_9PLEO|nr:Utp14-domain-containing protein [Massarina eburnea CBS 473.64]
MPPRLTHSSLPKGKPSKAKPAGRAPKKAAKRALNAFSIASHDTVDRSKGRKSRLGESDVDARRKRPRDDEEEEDEDEDEEGGAVKRRKQGRGNDSFDEGSDSEGNNWKMGHVDDDDESDIDSDEAFGESDEERFEGWTFRGSQSNRKGGKVKKKSRDVDMDDGDDLDLDEGESADGEEDDDDLGDDAIDLATALDQWEESEEETKPKKGKKAKKSKSAFDDSDDDEPSEVDDLAADGAGDFDSEDDEDDDKQERLKDLISSLAAEEEEKSAPWKAEIHESSAPSEFGVMRKIDLANFKSKIADPERKKALKLLQDDKPSTKRNDLSRKLEAPLPKRQQDKLDRTAANEKANTTLDRWVDTVKHNRRAEHLSFPLNQVEDGGRMGESRLLPTTTADPTNELESTIQSILQQSGLSNGKEDEEKFQQWETLQTNKLPLEEVLKRRAALRKERELLFREEVRAKRVKKIKSKSYRRVHRRERERLMQRERDALKADGVEVSEDEREYNDRRRAEERMGAKHRDSKWAKGVKASGKAAWDDDARAGVTEMARRNEELRRRIEGKDVRDEDEDASDLSSEEEDDDEDDDQTLNRQVGRLQENPFSTDKSKLGSMAFMQKAENARKKQNDEDIERIRKELAGEESNSEDEDENSTKAGRRKFGPGSKAAAPAIQVRGSEFEERAASESEDENGVPVNESTKEISTGRHRLKPSRNASDNFESSAQNPYLVQAKKSKSGAEPDLALQAFDTIAATQDEPEPKPKSKKKSKKSSAKASADQEADHGLAGNPTISTPDDDGFQTVTYNDDSDDIENEGIDLDLLTRNHALTASAFAGDNVEQEFVAEKAAVALDDDTQTTTTSLPGWGTWAGSDLSQAQKKHARHAGYKTTTVVEGVNAKKRKDAKLDRVIVNERRQKANTKYLAAQLPFPFENREQYERSLRLPQGPEWTTKRTHQQATKPRVVVRQGVVGALRKPLV